MKVQPVFSIFSQGIGNLPLLGKGEKLPVSAACLGAVIMAVQLLPEGILLFALPDDLRIRTAKDILSPPLELFAPRAVNDLIVFPVFCNEHESPPKYL